MTEVSAIIPARDEEANIERAVRSLAQQEAIREIIVADDQSQDGTPEILEALKKEIPMLRTLRIESLPEGWTGKAYALHQAARLATKDWLLFTDADTEHAPGSLSAFLERAASASADLLSASPGQRTPTWWEKSVIPLVYVHLARRYPYERVSDPRSPLVAANGQYVLIRRTVYERAGGHQAVKSEILEDVELARSVKSAGGRLVFLLGAPRVWTRMYRSFAAMWEGWTKNLFLLYERKLGRLLGTVGELFLLVLAPPSVLLALCIAFALGWRSATGAIVAVLCLLAMGIQHWRYAQALRRAGFEPSLAAYQSIGAAVFSLLLLNSARAYRLSGSVQWKGRRYRTNRA